MDVDKCRFARDAATLPHNIVGAVAGRTRTKCETASLGLPQFVRVSRVKGDGSPQVNTLPQLHIYCLLYFARVDFTLDFQIKFQFNGEFTQAWLPSLSTILA